MTKTTIIQTAHFQVLADINRNGRIETEVFHFETRNDMIDWMHKHNIHELGYLRIVAQNVKVETIIWT